MLAALVPNHRSGGVMRARGSIDRFEARVQKFRSKFLELPGLLRGIASATDVQLVHLVLERRSFQSEPLCGSASACDSPRGGFQSLDDDLPLSLFES